MLHKTKNQIKYSFCEKSLSMKIKLFILVHLLKDFYYILTRPSFRYEIKVFT